MTYSFGHRGGFTLIEALLYIALGAIVCSFLGAVVANILTMKVKSHLYSEALYTGEYAFERMRQASVESVHIAVPETGMQDSSIRFVSADGVETDFWTEAGALLMREGTDAPMRLSGERFAAELDVVRSVYVRRDSAQVRITLHTLWQHGVPPIGPQTYTASLMTSLP